MHCARRLLTLALFLTASSAVAITRCDREDPDGSARAAARASAEATCAASDLGCDAGTHGTYVRCIGQAAKDLADAGGLPQSCKGAVKKCASKSTCGKPGAVTCCITSSKGTKCSAAARTPATGNARTSSTIR
jgi:hypothetical protein